MKYKIIKNKRIKKIIYLKRAFYVFLLSMIIYLFVWLTHSVYLERIYYQTILAEYTKYTLPYGLKVLYSNQAMIISLLPALYITIVIYFCIYIIYIIPYTFRIIENEER